MRWCRMRVVMGLSVLLIGQTLGGCASHIADLPLVGLPANTPARPDVQPAYLPVGDVPPPRSQPVLTPAQQDQAAKDLTTARDQQTKSTSKAAATPSPQQ